MNKKGFTILETILSVTIFSVLMAIVFGAWTEFQKVSLKNESKQDTNVTFVNVYRNIDKIVSSSSVRLFRSYLDDTPGYLNFEHTNLRWFAFLLSRHNQQLDGKPIYKIPKKLNNGVEEDATTSEVLVYNTCVVYLLHTPNDNCGGFQNCPHKSLRRYVFSTTQSSTYDEIYFGGDENLVLKNFRLKVLEGTNAITVKNILDHPDSTTFPFSVIENNIVDLRIEKTDNKIRFFLTVLRMNDAGKHFEIGKKDLITPDNETKKYIENLSWISIPNNT